MIAEVLQTSLVGVYLNTLLIIPIKLRKFLMKKKPLLLDDFLVRFISFI